MTYKPEKYHRLGLRQVNIFITCLIVVINLYILAAPISPQIGLWLNKNKTAAVGGLPFKTKLDVTATTDDKRAEIPKENTLVIPKIGLNQKILTGSSPYLVNKGVWARPLASTPPKGSNTVLVGHRFTYDGPATFYSLDKVMVGDDIVVYWEGKEYDYKVRETKVVPATAIEIEDATKDTRLTIYTCTPIWSAKDRLVLVASLNEETL